MMKILVIDDDRDVLQTLKTFLDKEGHDVTCVDNATEGKRFALVDKPDLLLLDIKLPDISGIELLKQIKEIDKEACVVMITAYHDAESVIDAFRGDAFDCLLKPFNFTYFRENILNKIRHRN